MVPVSRTGSVAGHVETAAKRLAILVVTYRQASLAKRCTRINALESEREIGRSEEIGLFRV